MIMNDFTMKRRIVVGRLAVVAAILIGASDIAYAEAKHKVMPDKKIQSAGLQLLKSLPSSFSSTFKYHNGKQTKLKITIKYEKGKMEYVPAVRAPPWTRRPDTPARIRVTVVLHFSTVDGAFDETLKSVLEASMPHPDSASFQANTEKLQGKFSPDPDGYQFTGIGISGTLMAKGTQGAIRGGWRKPGKVPLSRLVGAWGR